MLGDGRDPGPKSRIKKTKINENGNEKNDNKNNNKNDKKNGNKSEKNDDVNEIIIDRNGKFNHEIITPPLSSKVEVNINFSFHVKSTILFIFAYTVENSLLSHNNIVDFT